jgi:hypothetical protein
VAVAGLEQGALDRKRATIFSWSKFASRSTFRICTSSTSAGSASAIATGPVRIWDRLRRGGEGVVGCAGRRAGADFQTEFYS